MKIECIILSLVTSVKTSCSSSTDTLFLFPAVLQYSADEISVDDDAPAATFAFASYYANDMVLQRGPSRASVWGSAPLSDVGRDIKLQVVSEGANYTMTYQGTVSKGRRFSQLHYVLQCYSHSALQCEHYTDVSYLKLLVFAF